MLDLLHEEGLVALVVVARKEAGIADDVVQRRAYLVAHVRQEGLFQQLRLLCLLRLHGQALLCLHHIRDVAIGAEVALHLAIGVKHGHHVEQQPYLSALLVANLYLYGLHNAELRQVVHPVQRGVHGAAESRRGQSDTAQLRHVDLGVGLSVDELEGVGVGVVVHHLHATHAQGIVDVGDILLDAVCSLLQLLQACLLAMERVHHLRDVVARHIDALQLALFVVDGVDGRLVIHPATQAKLIHAVYFLVPVIIEVHNAACVRVLHLVERHLIIEGIVLQQEAAVENLFAALRAEGLAGALVDVFQHALVVVVQHVEHRQVEDGVVAKQQLFDLLLSAVLIGHIVLDAHQRSGHAVVVTTGDGDGYFIVTAVGILGRPAAYGHFAAFLLAIANIEDDAPHLIQVIRMKETAKLNGVVLALIVASFRQVAIMAGGWVEKP